MILGVPACPACLQSLQTCLYTITNCHIINPSLPHRRTRPLPAPVLPDHHHHNRQYWEHQHYHEHQHHKPPVVWKCAQGWIGGRKGRGKGWGSRCDSSRAPGMFLFFFLDYTNTYLHLEVRLRDPNNVWAPVSLPHTTTPSTAAAAVTDYCRHLRTTRKGPNDASHVVRALGEFFYIYSCFLLYTNDFYRSYLGYTRKNDDNGPKRRVTRRLGTRWVFFFKFIRVSRLY